MLVLWVVAAMLNFTSLQWWLLHKIGLLLVSWHGGALAVALVVCPTVGGSGATPRNSAHAPGPTFGVRRYDMAAWL